MSQSYQPIPTNDPEDGNYLRVNQGERVGFISKKESRQWRRSRHYGTGSRRTSLVEVEAETLQPGVRKMQEIVKGKEWKYGWARVALYFCIYLLSFLTSLESNTIPTIEPYLMSYFSSHSLLSTISVGVSIAYAIGKPPLAKILDVFGRSEGIMVSGGLWFLGFMGIVVAQGIGGYGVSRIIAALGGQGLQLAQQVVVADTSNISSRALITSTISLPWLLTTWVGPPIGAWFIGKALEGSTDLDPQPPSIYYRIPYLIFGVLVPVGALFWAGTIWYSWREVKKSQFGFLGSSESISTSRSASPLRERRPSEREGFPEAKPDRGLWAGIREILRELDVIGLTLLCLGCAGVLIPLSLSGGETSQHTRYILAGVFCVSVLLLIFFVRYELRYSKIPIVPERLLKNRTVIGGCGLGLWHFISMFVYETYFTSFLQVARGHSPRDAQYISQSYLFTACISAMVIGVLIKLSKRYKIWGIIGVLFHVVGQILMIRFRNLNNPTWELVLSQVISGFGGGFTTIVGQIGIQSVVSPQDIAVATAVFLTVTQIGGAIGSSISGLLWSLLLPKRLKLHLPESAHKDIPEIIESLTYALSFPIGSPERTGINQAYTDVQRVLNLSGLWALIPVMVCMLMMKDIRMEDETTEELGSSESSSLIGNEN